MPGPGGRAGANGVGGRRPCAAQRFALPPGRPGCPLRAGRSVVSLCGLREKIAAMSESSDAAPAAPQDPGISDPRAPAERRRGRRLPPTHFLALPVQAPAAHEAIVEVQRSLVEHTLALAQALVDVAAAHFTLGVLCLNQGQLQDAKRVLMNFDWDRKSRRTGVAPACAM